MPEALGGRHHLSHQLGERRGLLVGAVAGVRVPSQTLRRDGQRLEQPLDVRRVPGARAGVLCGHAPSLTSASRTA